MYNLPLNMLRNIAKENKAGKEVAEIAGVLVSVRS